MSEIVMASPDVESGHFYESTDYGWEVPAGLWVQYQAALAKVTELEREIDRCPVKPMRIPPEGTIGRMLWDGYAEEFRRGAETLARMRKRP